MKIKITFLMLKYPLATLLIIQAVLWTLLPLFFIGNFHVDTLEAAYWAQDITLGYRKHPPLTSWLLGSVLALDAHPIFSILLASQIIIAVAAIYIYLTARRLVEQELALFTTALFLGSPASTFYAVQMNHNSVLLPFTAATLYYGLTFLQDRKWGQSLALGLAAGLGALTKYEILFAILPLFLIALVWREFRSVFKSVKTYAAIAVFCVVISPHIIWLYQNDWQSILHATNNSSLNSLAAWGETITNLVFGMVAIGAVPALIIGSNRLRLKVRNVSSLRSIIAFAILLAPPIMIIIGSLVTSQIIKPLWFLPLTGMTVLGLILCLDEDQVRPLITTKRAMVSGVVSSGAMLVIFFIFLLISDLINQPFAAYSAQMKPLGPAITRVWSTYSKAPLGCLVLRDRKLTAAAILYPGEKARIIDDVTQIDDLVTLHPDCVAQGGLWIRTPETDDPAFYHPKICFGKTKTIEIRSMLGVATSHWQILLTPFDGRRDNDCRQGG